MPSLDPDKRDPFHNHMGPIQPLHFGLVNELGELEQTLVGFIYEDDPAVGAGDAMSLQRFEVGQVAHQPELRPNNASLPFVAFDAVGNFDPVEVNEKRFSFSVSGQLSLYL